MAVSYKNVFTVLDDDSDSEHETLENSITVEPIAEAKPEVAPDAEAEADAQAQAQAQAQANPEPPLTQDQGEVQKEQQSYRTWIRDESENRFAGDEVKKNIFSSPFSKHKKSWSQQRSREDNEGWVSIRWTQPLFEESAQSEPETLSVQYEPRTEEMQFPSLLTRGNASIPTKIIPSSEDDNLNASMWAERIKKNLEKAEQNRMNKQKEEPPATRLSFFRTQI